jgi:hypothetical protein
MINATVLEEPTLEFRYGQRLSRPQDGLSLFGPYDRDMGSRPGSVTYSVVGTSDGLAMFKAFSRTMQQPVPGPEGKSAQLWPFYPGFDVAFGVEWPSGPAWEAILNRGELINAANIFDKYERVHAVVSLMLGPLETAQKRDEQPRVILIVVPDEVWKTCRPRQVVSDGHGVQVSNREIKDRVRGYPTLFDSYDPQIYRLAPDFRRQLKARVMKHGTPIQIIRESTLSLETERRFSYRGLTPLSDRMWNLGTALYYKAGGKPWRLATAREGVCYVGIAFRLENPEYSTKNGCCAAQMFLDDGDGVVFVGENGPWYAPKTRQFHLTPKAAEALLAGVLQTYQDLHSKPLTEVFLHSRSGIEAAEFAGYRAAVPNSIQLVAVRVRTAWRGPRLFRQGTRPVLRGTFLRTSAKSGYLWSSGFKPELGTYDGWDVPVPLSLEVQHGEADIEQVARDILGLTKLNYNACKVGDSQPVTVGFSDAVGEILLSNPGVTHRRPQFRFYI